MRDAICSRNHRIVGWISAPTLRSLHSWASRRLVLSALRDRRLFHSEQRRQRWIGHPKPMRAFSFASNLLGAAALAFAVPLAILVVGVPIAIVVSLLLGFLGWL
jgi:hypothetical protein